ncbi:hypothetical protein D3C74_391530 [compost metagenome]
MEQDSRLHPVQRKGPEGIFQNQLSGSSCITLALDGMIYKIAEVAILCDTAYDIGDSDLSGQFAVKQEDTEHIGSVLVCIVHTLADQQLLAFKCIIISFTLRFKRLVMFSVAQTQLEQIICVLLLQQGEVDALSIIVKLK